MTTKKLTKLLALYLPYILLGLAATNFGEAWRLAEGKELGDKIMSMMGTVPVAFANPLPSLHPLDLLVGLCCGAGLRLAVYLRGKNAKKYRHGVEYGSARWGTPKDIEPFMAPKFADNIILTKTERLMMSNRPPDPKNARNKNVLVVGGSGSGKTRFWLKPNLLQCHSSYVVTDPKGSIVVECGNALLKNSYKLKILNTINFSKSMHYNPFAYVHSEKDILKLVTTLMTNTKGEGSGGDPFWEKSERLLLTALIAYLHYEAPVEEQNFATLLEMLNTMQVSEDDETYQNPVDLLFEDLGKKKPKSFAVRQYKLYKLAAGVVCSKRLLNQAVHGEYKQLKKHAITAASLGIPTSNILIAENGSNIILSQDEMKLGEPVTAGAVMVDGLGVGDVGNVVLRDRKHLSEDGLVIIVATVDSKTGKVLAGPDLVSRGFVYVRENESLMDGAQSIVETALDRCVDEHVRDWNSVKTRVREALSSYIYRRTKRSPMILPILMEV